MPDFAAVIHAFVSLQAPSEAKACGKCLFYGHNSPSIDLAIGSLSLLSSIWEIERCDMDGVLLPLPRYHC